MLIWLTIYDSVAAVRSAAVSPNENVVPRATEHKPQDLNGSFKYCCCADDNHKKLDTPTNDVYNDYHQTLGDGVKLNHDKHGHPFVSYSVFIISSFQPAVLSSPFTSFFPSYISLIFSRH
jgi:hypothetical protein